MKELLSQIENLNVSHMSGSSMQSGRNESIMSPEINFPIEGSIRRSRESVSQREEIEMLHNSQQRLFLSEEGTYNDEEEE